MQTFTIDTLLSSFAMLLLMLVMSFLIYGMLRGYFMEKDMRLRNRRKYS